MSESYKRHGEVIKTMLTELVLLLHFGFVMAGGVLIIKYNEAVEKGKGGGKEPAVTGVGTGVSVGTQGPQDTGPAGAGAADGKKRDARGFADCLADSGGAVIPLFTVTDIRGGNVYLADYIEASVPRDNRVGDILTKKPRALSEREFLDVAKSLEKITSGCRYAYAVPLKVIERNDHTMAFGRKTGKFLFEVRPRKAAASTPPIPASRNPRPAFP